MVFLAPKKVQSKKTLGLDKATPTLCMNLPATCGLHRDTVKQMRRFIIDPKDESRGNNHALC
ncbi:MAG: hypothetical protein CMM07_01095 [Rhodopirellula sp.]|nr:hypothetical protein [Rhodopirellula sp.]